MTKRAKQITKVLVLLLMALVSTAGYTSCEIDTPGGYVSLETDAPGIVVADVNVVVKRGELNVDYSIDGLSCGATGVESMSFKLYRGSLLVARDSNFSCNTLRGLTIDALTSGNYSLELTGYNRAGRLLYSFNGSIYHNGINTSVDVALAPM